MPNMAVAYQRPNRSLVTLRDEVYKRYNYTPARASEFVTGYKSPSNFTGHNADANGIVHAIDIFTDESGNLPEAQGRDLAEKLRAIGRATGRFSYLIHDMSPGAPDPRIAGAFSDWEWQPYTGESPHSDHIHVSTVDLYWGDPVTFPADVYDSTEPWGIAGITNAGGAVRPIPEEDELSAADIKTITDKLDNMMGVLLYGYNTAGKQHPGIAPVVEENQRRIGAIPAAVWAAPVRRGNGTVPALQEVADTKTKVLGLEPAIAEIQANTAEGLAAIVPDDLAQQVIDALSARLAGGNTNG